MPGVTRFANACKTSPSDVERYTVGTERGVLLEDEVDVRCGEAAGERSVINPASDPNERTLAWPRSGSLVVSDAFDGPASSAGEDSPEPIHSKGGK